MAELAMFGTQALCALTGIAVTVGAWWFGVREPAKKLDPPPVLKDEPR